jgi:hypothetical protein
MFGSLLASTWERGSKLKTRLRQPPLNAGRKPHCIGTTSTPRRADPFCRLNPNCRTGTSEIDLAPQMKSPGRTGARPGLSLGSLSTCLSQPIRPGVVNVTTAADPHHHRAALIAVTGLHLPIRLCSMFTVRSIDQADAHPSFLAALDD